MILDHRGNPVLFGHFGHFGFIPSAPTPARRSGEQDAEGAPADAVACREVTVFEDEDE